MDFYHYINIFKSINYFLIYFVPLNKALVYYIPVFSVFISYKKRISHPSPLQYVLYPQDLPRLPFWAIRSDGSEYSAPDATWD